MKLEAGCCWLKYLDAIFLAQLICMGTFIIETIVQLHLSLSRWEIKMLLFSWNSRRHNFLNQWLTPCQTHLGMFPPDGSTRLYWLKLLINVCMASEQHNVTMKTRGIFNGGIPPTNATRMCHSPIYTGGAYNVFVRRAMMTYTHGSQMGIRTVDIDQSVECFWI